MEDRLQADLYLRPAGPAGADRHPTLAPDMAARIAAASPGVAAVDPFRAYEISYQGMPATLGGGDARIAGRYGKRPFLSGAQPAGVFAQLPGRDNVLVSEPFANKHQVRAGRHRWNCRSAGGAARFRVVDVYTTIRTSAATSSWTAARCCKYLPDPAPSNLAVYLRPGVGLETGAARSRRPLRAARS